MDLQEYLKKEEERVKKLGEELAGAIRAEEANAKSQEKSAQDDKQAEQIATRAPGEIRADLEEAKKNVAAAKDVNDMSLGEKLGEMAKDAAGAALNLVGDLTDHLQARASVEAMSAAKTGVIDHVIPAIVEGTTGNPEMGEVARQAGQIIDQHVEIAGGPENVFTVVAAYPPVTQALQDAKVTPNIDEMQKVDDLKEKQDKETKALEKQIDNLEKKFEERHANNPNKEKLHEEFEKQTDLLRDALERKQQKEAIETRDKALLQEPMRTVW
jgi:hypothetical protein